MFDNIKSQPAQADNNQNGFNNPPSPSSGYNPTPVNPASGTGPGSITDMYAETDRLEKPDAFKPKQILNETNPGFNGLAPQPPDESGGNMQKIFTLLIVIIGLVILGAGGYYGFKFYKKNFSPKTDITATENTVSNVGQTATENNNATNEPVVTEPVTEPDNQETVNENNVPVTEPEITTPETPATTTEEVPVILDTDQDGLTDSEEAALGTTPTNVDSDSDGLSDREEFRVYKTNPLNADTDGDSFNDGDEIKKGYNPNGPGKLLDINNQQ